MTAGVFGGRASNGGPLDARDDVVIRGPVCERYEGLLRPAAMDFLAALHGRFDRRRRELLHRRMLVQREIACGMRPDFSEKTAAIRSGAWSGPSCPADLADRRVEVVGPADRQALRGAFTSGANVFVADFDGATSPRWAGVLESHALLTGVVQRRLPGPGQPTPLPERMATPMVRPRGWEQTERHVVVDGQPMSASLFDFGLYFMHNARALIARGSGAYFSLAHLQGQLEARLWSEVFQFAEAYAGLARGTIRATLLADHVLGVLELHEMVWELREYVTAVGCDRTGFLASRICAFRGRGDAIFPGPDTLPTDCRALRSHADFVIQVAHRRGLHALAGMTALAPSGNGDGKGRLRQARLEAMRAVTAGFDGMAVAHPALVPPAREIYDAYLPGPHQIDWTRDDVSVSADDLLARPRGAVTAIGVRRCMRAALVQLAAWLGGVARVEVDGELVDAAATEFARAQLWQWATRQVRLADGGLVTPQLLKETLADELERVRAGRLPPRVDDAKLSLAARILSHLTMHDSLREPVAVLAYEYLN